MKKLWLVLIALLVGSCTPQLRLPDVQTTIAKLPRKWEAPKLYVRLPADVPEGHRFIEMAVALCKEFTVRLYDAFDGQVYISEFVIVNPSLMKEREEGMCNLFEEGSLLYRNESYVGNPPLHPGRFYCTIPFRENYVKWCAGTMLHEWLHTFIGLGDEYKREGELGNDMTTSCPLNPNSEKNLDENACVMYLSRSRRELCRPENHNSKTDQGKESCWSKASRVLFENRLALILAPAKPVKGPLDPPTPKITIRLK